MIPKINPKQMEKMMRQMGIQQEELEVSQVIIKLADHDLVFDNPSVSKVGMSGQMSYQITGEPKEVPHDTTPEINEDDIKTVMEQAGVNEEKAREALENAKGDIAQAILDLQ
jgi:nascent polypeptide-associated complex subunit alpha